MFMYNHLSIINTVLFYRKTTKNHKYALALVFAMDEINRNPDLLPNMSLIIRYTLGRCDGKTVIPTPYLFHKKKQSPIPNYFCNEESMCSFLLTGPNWEVSLNFWMYLDSFLSPRVSHRPGILNIMSLWGTLIAIKKVNGCGWTYAYVNLGCSRILTIQKNDRLSNRDYHQKLTDTFMEE